jgi:hypothetical protein
LARSERASRASTRSTARYANRSVMSTESAGLQDPCAARCGTCPSPIKPNRPGQRP